MIFKVFVLMLIILKITLSHYDPAYFHSADDEFNAYPNWMENISDEVMLNELALPGTHNSAAFTSTNWNVQCQAINFNKQLLYGIRVIDIRFRHIDNKFALHHGPFFLDSFFGNFLVSVRDFLNQYSSEVVLFRLKKEHDSGDNTRSLLESLEQYLDKFKEHYLKVDTNIKLGLARGKFIILVNVVSFRGYGIPYANLDIQDNYELDFMDLYGKWKSVWKHLHKSTFDETDKSKFYVNYLSGSGILVFPYFIASGHILPCTSSPRLWTLTIVAEGATHPYPSFPRLHCAFWLCSVYYEGTNILARDFISTVNSYGQFLPIVPKRTIGIIMADFPGTDLIYKIIENNKFLGNGNNVPKSEISISSIVSKQPNFTTSGYSN